MSSFRVVRCFNCQTFQVDAVKKAAKWECKICGNKQSLKQIFAEGTAKECRITVQEMNKAQFEAQSDLEAANVDLQGEPKPVTNNTQKPLKTSKWSKFVDEDGSV